MSGKKSILLRIDERLFDCLKKWAADDLRSMNAQIEYLLAEAAKKTGRYHLPGGPSREPPPS